MTKIKMDAVIVATSIRKGDFSKLRGKSFEVCDNKNMGKNKYTLSQVCTKLDQIGDAVMQLTSSFTSLKQEVKDINVRLDYIVKANSLKDSPKKTN